MNINGAEGMSPGDIRDEINRGGRLVIYTYCFSIVVMTFKRPTEIRLVRAGQNAALASWPFVVVSLLFGWWGFPWGPIYTIECIYRNLGGGLDVTDDVLRQILPAEGSGRSAALPVPPTLTVAPVQVRGFNWKAARLMSAAMGLIITLGLSVYCYQQQQTLTVVLASGLAQPYRITLNGEPYTLQPFAHEILELPEGEFVLADAPGGNVVGGEKKFTFALPFFAHLHSDRVAIINPDRLGVFVNGEVPYYSDSIGPPKDETPVFSVLANQAAYFLPTPDFVFTEADQRIDMPSGTTRLVKSRLYQPRGLGLGPVVESIAEKSGYPAAREHLMLRARHRTDEELLRTAAQVLKPEDLRPFFQLHLADRPVLVEWHRYYQHHMEAHHSEHDLVADYRAWLQADPGNGALAYLLGRQLNDPAEQNKMWQEALAANPPCHYAHGAMGFDALSEGRFAEALAHYDESFKAGITSTGLNHYRRLVHYALGRTAELLPELAAARKQAPLDLQLAEEEIRLTYAVAGDAAAAAKLKSAYLTAYAATKPGEKNLADADAFLQSSIAYLTGDLPAYARLIARFESPFYQFRAALSSGRLADAAKTTSLDDPNSALLLYLLAHRNGDATAAEELFKAAQAALKKGDHESRLVATQLEAGSLDTQSICHLHMNLESKRILLTALGVRLTADRASYFDMARKLNFNPEFPHQFLRTILQE